MLFNQKHLKTSIGLLVAFALLFPFFFVLSNFDFHRAFEFGDFIWAAKNTLLQAAFSAILSLILGLWCAFALNFYKEKNLSIYQSLRFLCLVPNLIPVLFVIISFFAIIDPFPMGIVGIVLIHSFLNFGIAALAIQKISEDKFGSYLDVCLVQGVSRGTFLRKVFFPMAKKDLFLLLLLIFTLCFTSFSVPLIVGGGRGTTLEVLIYEKIRVEGDWGGASIIALLQSLFVFLLAMGLARSQSHSLQRFGSLKLVSHWSGIFPVLGALVVLLGGYGAAVYQGVPLFMRMDISGDEVASLAVGSVLLTLLAALISYLLLMSIAFVSPFKFFNRFLEGFLSPGTALAGFSFLVVFPKGSFFDFFTIALAFATLNVASLYRMGWGHSLYALERQVEVSKILGASEWMVFAKVKWPQLHAKAIDLTSFVAVWICGDFALSRILATRDISLAMSVETLMSSYRLPQAAVLSLFLLLTIAISILIIQGVGRVIYRKFIL